MLDTYTPLPLSNDARALIKYAKKMVQDTSSISEEDLATSAYAPILEDSYNIIYQYRYKSGLVLAEKFSCVKHGALIVFSKIEIHITSHICEYWDGPIEEEYYYRHALNLPTNDVDLSWVGDLLTFGTPVTRIVADIEHGGECLNV